MSKKNFKGHSNKNENSNDHHVYEIIDSVDSEYIKLKYIDLEDYRK